MEGVSLVRLHLLDYDNELDAACQQQMAIDHELTLGDLSEDVFDDEHAPEAVLAVYGRDPRAILRQLKQLMQQQPKLLAATSVLMASPIPREHLRELRALGVAGVLPIPRSAPDLGSTFAYLEQSAADRKKTGEPSELTSDLLSRLHMFAHDFLTQFPLGAVFLSPKRRIVWSNVQAPRLLFGGDQQMELLGRELHEVFPPSIVQPIVEHWGILTSPECIDPLEIVAPFRRKMLQMTLSPIIDRGAVSGVGFLFTDQSFQNDIIGMRGVMLGQIAEQLLEQTDSLIEGVQLAQSSTKAVAMDEASGILGRVFPITQQIENSASQILRMAQEMSSGGSTRRRFDFAAVIKDILAGFHRIIQSKNLEVVSSGLDDLYPIPAAYPRLLMNTCFNLIRNTLRYAVPNSRVEVTLTIDEGPVDLRLTHQPKDQLSQDAIDRIIEGQRNQGMVHQGNMLNLKTMIEVASMHGGTLEMFPVGAERLGFQLQLPSHTGAVVERPADAPSRFREVLVVDSTPGIMDLLEQHSEDLSVFFQPIASVSELEEVLETVEGPEAIINLMSVARIFDTLLEKSVFGKMSAVRLSSLVQVDGDTTRDAFDAVVFGDTPREHILDVITAGAAQAAAANGTRRAIIGNAPEEKLPRALQEIVQEHPPFTYKHAETPEQAVAMMEQGSAPCFILNYRESDQAWFDSITDLRCRDDVPAVKIIAFIDIDSGALGTPVRFLRSPFDQLTAALRGEDE